MPFIINVAFSMSLLWLDLSPPVNSKTTFCFESYNKSEDQQDKFNFGGFYSGRGKMRRRLVVRNEPQQNTPDTFTSQKKKAKILASFTNSKSSWHFSVELRRLRRCACAPKTYKKHQKWCASAPYLQCFMDCKKCKPLNEGCPEFKSFSSYPCASVSISG